MDNNVLPFPQAKRQVSSISHYAIVTDVRNGFAVAITSTSGETLENLTVYAHHKNIKKLRKGDWVRFVNTSRGVVIEEKLLRPTARPVPKVAYHDGRYIVDLSQSALSIRKVKQQHRISL